MKHSLDLNLIHADKAKIQEVLDALPAATDTTVWEEQYTVSDIKLDDESGFLMATSMIRFHEDSGREQIYQAITNIQGILQGFEVGTKIQKHICYHDGEAKPCEVEIVYEVVA